MKLYYPNRTEEVQRSPNDWEIYTITRAETPSQTYGTSALRLSLANGRNTKNMTLAKHLVAPFLKGMNAFRPRDLIGKTVRIASETEALFIR